MVAPSYLLLSKRIQLEELLHPELKVEAKAVADGPDIDNLTGPQPEGGDEEGGDGGHQLLQDVVMVLSNVIIDIPGSPKNITLGSVPTPPKRDSQGIFGVCYYLRIDF